MKRLLALMFMLSLWLSGCGKLEVLVEPTPTPIPTTIPELFETATANPATPTSPPSDRIPPASLIAFETQFQQSFSDIAVIHADGSGYAQLTTYGYNSDPVLSPDGRFIAYRSIPASLTALPDPGSRLYEGYYNIWVIMVDGAQAWKLTDSETPRGLPVWSADSGKVIFSEGVEGRIVEVEFATQTQREWLAQGGFAPRYKPDGNGIGYLNAEGNLIWLDADGVSHLVVDARALSPSLRVNDFNWMPNGESVVFALADDSGRIGGSTLGIVYSLWLLPLGGSATHLAEDTHNAQPSPDGKTLAVQQGSGYGDACGVDLRQAFLYLTEAGPILQTVDTFTGRPAGDSFYPTSPITWLSEQFAVATFGITCAPNGTAAFGPYWMDIGGAQLQQITFQRAP